MLPAVACTIILVMGQIAVFGGVRSEELLQSPGFELVSGTSAVGWAPFEQGYSVTGETVRTGTRAIMCRNGAYEDRRGATATITLNQAAPRPILITGWSKAESVGGFRNNDYSVYVDLVHTDGTPLWGQTAPFSVGTHDWQRRQVLVFPTKPIKRLLVHALFRHHTGTVWFDDFSVRELAPEATFDGQPIGAPRLPSGASSAWFVRDVGANGPLRLVARGGLVNGSGCKALQIAVDRLTHEPGAAGLRVLDAAGRNRCLSIYYVERVPSGDVVWWHDMRRSTRCSDAGEHANLVRVGVGATGMQSLYPLACATGPRFGRAIGVNPADGPQVVRFGYHASSRLLYAAFDVALVSDNVRNSERGRGTARVSVARWDVDPAWGFRSALARYYRMFPKAFDRRADKDGIWIPFADPASVQGYEDFGIAYHEGDNSVASDDRLGIWSFRYTEPMTWWMPMPPEAPRTYAEALGILDRHLRGSSEPQRQLAQAVRNSGTHDEHGAFNVEFQNAPWTNGAVWVLNPNPALPCPPDEATKATLSYTSALADRLYGPGSPGQLDGEYLDSIEGWADVLDYRPESLQRSSVPVTYATDELRPVVPTWFSVYELARTMSEDLRRRGKLLMANATPWRIHAFAPLLDVMGTETNWMPGGAWRPDPDSVFCLRRSLCYRKPYLLLQNTDFDRFGPEQVERYFQRSMFYGVFPSMFSVDASTRNYWTQPQWYNRDRALFRKYIPIISQLSRAGWEPITGARSSRDDVYVERFGARFVTVLNDSGQRREVSLSLDRRTFGLLGNRAGIFNAVTGEAIVATTTRDRIELRLTLEIEECVVLRVDKAGASPMESSQERRR